MPRGAGLVLSAGTGLTVWRLEPAPAQPVIRSEYALPAAQTFRNTFSRYVSISPDGSHFVYNANWGFFVRDMNAIDARAFPGTEGRVTAPVLPPDGQSLAFLELGSAAESRGQLKKIPLTGGLSVALIPTDGLFGMSWSHDGNILYSDGGQVWQVSQNGGDSRLAVARVSTKSGVTFGSPQLIPFSLTGGHLSNSLRAFDVLPDGRFVGLATPSAIDSANAAGQSAPRIRYVVNWFEELKRLAPAK